MTFNVRAYFQEDKTNAWPNRVDQVAKLISEEKPFIIGMQEIRLEMIHELAAKIPSYKWIGEERLAGDETNAIFYNTNLLHLKISNTFWLSETPYIKESISWNSACHRICTWGEFVHKDNHDTKFRFFNTHLDHESELARKNGIQVIGNIMQELNKQNLLPNVLTGDFNCYPSSDPVQYCEKVLGLQNAYHFLTNEEHKRKSFHEFNGGIDGEPIDYIFTSSKWKIVRAQILQRKIGDVYPSDHYPVVAHIVLN